MMENEDYSESEFDYGFEIVDDDGDCFEAVRDCTEFREPSIVSVITKESLLSAQKKELEIVVNLLGVSEQHARTLLIYYRWDVQRIFEKLEKIGRKMLFLEAGVTVVECKPEIFNGLGSSITCAICFEDVALDLITVMDCGHYFCDICWTGHFVVRISEGQSRRIRCMDPKCNSICDEAIVRNLVVKKYPEITKQYERILLESYVEDNNKVKWCPSMPHCGNAIRVDGDLHCEVECVCGMQFCFSCLSQVHSPCSCVMWDLWSKKCNNESANMNWISVYTKMCPRCHKYVEKNGGCNLVSCVCGQPFCWLCGGATGKDHTWTTISDHTCNRFTNTHQKKAQLARKDHNRLVHYHDRYKAHIDSLNQESSLIHALRKKIRASQNKDSNSKIDDYSWALNGMNRLFRSRRVLAYTYPFAYYMFGGELFKDEMLEEEREMKQNLFENQQQQLECNVEKLSMFLEKDFRSCSDEDVYEIKWRVLDLSRILDYLCMQMYQCIENDLLETVDNRKHKIAPYKSYGVERLPEMLVVSDYDRNASKFELSELSTDSDSDSESDQDMKNRKGSEHSIRFDYEHDARIMKMDSIGACLQKLLSCFLTAR